MHGYKKYRFLNTLKTYQYSVILRKVKTFARTKGLIVSVLFFWIFASAQLLVFDISSSATFWITMVFSVAALAMKFLFFVQDNGVFDLGYPYRRIENGLVIYHAVNVRLWRFFIATLPGFSISFSCMGVGIVAVPDGSIWWRLFFVYSFFIFMMVCSYTLYTHAVEILYAKARHIREVVHNRKPSVVFFSYMRYLNKFFVMSAMNILWTASSYACVYWVVGRIFPSITDGVLFVMWSIMILPFFAVTIGCLRKYWNTIESTM